MPVPMRDDAELKNDEARENEPVGQWFCSTLLVFAVFAALIGATILLRPVIWLPLYRR